MTAQQVAAAPDAADAAARPVAAAAVGRASSPGCLCPPNPNSFLSCLLSERKWALPHDRRMREGETARRYVVAVAWRAVERPAAS